MEISRDAVQAALATVIDPEIRRPITEIGMLKGFEISGGRVAVEVYLTIAACPMKDAITTSVQSAVGQVAGVTEVSVSLEPMSDEQREQLRNLLQGPKKVISFNEPESLTRIYAIASGKGGVGKSSVTVNLAAALAASGKSVGILDADIYGHSIPDMLGLTGGPTPIDGMMLPQSAHGISVMSMLPFKPGGKYEPIAARGPMLHKYVEAFLTDVYWSDLDVLLFDMPPGTGDVPMSVARLLPQAELIVVTTPQIAAADVAIRSGMLAPAFEQKVFGVIENMSGFACPGCGETMELFGSGGGETVAKTLSESLEYEVPLLAKIGFDSRLREGGDSGAPLVVDHPDAPASLQFMQLAQKLVNRPRTLSDLKLKVLS
mgnify:FL=1